MEDQLNTFYWLDVTTRKILMLQDYTENWDFAETAQSFADWAPGRIILRILDYEAFKKEEYRNN